MKKIQIIFTACIFLAFGASVAQSANANPQVQAFEKKANDGDLVSMNMLGNIYKNGSLGVDKNLAEAVKWWEKAAEKDYAPAYFNLGIMYETGSDVTPKDINKAKEYYQKAVNLGFTKASERLANLPPSPQSQISAPPLSSNSVETPSNYPSAVEMTHSSAVSWDYAQPQAIFYCSGFDNKGQRFVNGIEFSFRPKGDQSSRGVCKNFLAFSNAAITGNNLLDRKIKGLRNKLIGGGDFHFYTANIEESYPFEALMYVVPGNPKFGWYRINSNSAFEKTNKGLFSRHKKDIFSTAVFTPPIDGMPKQGASKYSGIASDPEAGNGNPGQNIETSVATIDHIKNEISINTNFKSGYGDLVVIRSTKAMKIDKETGRFSGEISVTTSSTNPYPKNSTNLYLIVGLVGGKNADTIVALYANGNAVNFEGTNFIIGKKDN